ncbi:U-box domain-containing protein 33 [Phtheirospermum japonicum]|uniref:U-box domain-containing protein 33 n=1 Tax=Phtheirospermum japonicum TaxID=374723 RepID=A0A830CT91_9LAMI|nr:U-box domain-containing protein 33 [Phtheirospermum japonicum]
MPSNLIIGSFSEVSDEAPRLRAHYNDQREKFTGGGVSEIEEEESPAASSDGLKIHLATIREEAAAEGRLSKASVDFGQRGEDVVYVAVGKQGGDDQASMGALIWALKNAAINPSSVVFLVHVFPETKYIPTPLGNLPISQVNRDQKEKYMAQERDKRRNFLHKFLKVCSDSEVKADTILIESELEAKAILDLIPILNIRNLVVGATKSTVRRMKSRKGNGVVDQIVQNAPEFCEIKIICEGKEMSELMMETPSSSSSPRSKVDQTPRFGQAQVDSTGCGCFKL